MFIKNLISPRKALHFAGAVLGMTVLFADCGTSLQAEENYVFENLGRPITPKPLPLEAITVNKTGERIAWGWVSDPDRFGVFGIDIKTGKSTFIDLRQYRRSSQIRLDRGKNGHLYIYAGSPARFFKYDIDSKELRDLGCPASPAFYITGHAMSEEGVFYVGSYPGTHLVSVNTETDEVKYVARIAKDNRQKYIISPVIGGDGTIYIPVGLHHSEVWAFNPKTGEQTQILSGELNALQGVATLYVNQEGEVYGESKGTSFRCHPDRTEIIPALPKGLAKLATPKLDGIEYVELDKEGRLVSRNVETGATERLKSDFAPGSTLLYSIAEDETGKIWGGSFKPSNTWSYVPKTGEMEDWGRLVVPQTQVYDTLKYKDKLYLSSYSFAWLDQVDPVTRKVTRIGNLNEKHGMERIQHLVVGSDEMIYGPTRPAKGYLDGGIVKVNPKSLDFEVVVPIIKGLAPTSLVLIEETGEFFGTTTTQGGTSAIATEKDARVFIWDPKTSKVVWSDPVIPGVKGWIWAARGSNGLIYGVGDSNTLPSTPSPVRWSIPGNFPSTKVVPYVWRGVLPDRRK